MQKKLLTCKAKDRALCYNSLIEKYGKHITCASTFSVSEFIISQDSDSVN